MPRPIITIDEEKCNGCGQCVLDCAEGALAIIDGKAKLISESYCDGLGACLNCPQNALTLTMQDAPPFDEKKAMEALAKRQSKAQQLTPLAPLNTQTANIARAKINTWPIQLALLPPNAAFLKNSHILLGAHCAGFALPEIEELLKDKVPVIACPKLENCSMLEDKLSQIIKNNNLCAITVLRMSVPCCKLDSLVQKALEKACVKTPVFTHIVKLN